MPEKIDVKAFRDTVAEVARANGWRVFINPPPSHENSVNAGFPELMMYQDDKMIAMTFKAYPFESTQAEMGWIKAMQMHFPAYEIVCEQDSKVVSWILTGEWDDPDILNQIDKEETK